MINCNSSSLTVLAHDVVLTPYPLPPPSPVPALSLPCPLDLSLPSLYPAPQVNDALNNLLIEEEDFEALKHSIQSYDNFDQVLLAP